VVSAANRLRRLQQLSISQVATMSFLHQSYVRGMLLRVRWSSNYLASAFYYTALVGNPKDRPTITAAASFTGMAVIGMLYKLLFTFFISNLALDADPYIANGQYWVNQNVRTSIVHLDILIYFGLSYSLYRTSSGRFETSISTSLGCP
jgi:hypothetical protein